MAEERRRPEDAIALIAALPLADPAETAGVAMLSLHSYFVAMLDGQRGAGPAVAAVRVVEAACDLTGAPAALLAGWHDSFGRLLAVPGDNPAAVAEFERALAHARDIGDDALIGSALGNLANTYRNVGRLGAARQAYLEALDYSERAGDERALVNRLINLSLVYSDLGDGPLERHTLDEAGHMPWRQEWGRAGR